MQRSALRLFILLIALAGVPAAGAQPIEPARDLAQSARSAATARAPLLVFFTQPDCPFCEEARRNYLGPMSAAPVGSGAVRIVEVDVTSDAALVDFSGRLTTHREFARAQRVGIVPVVLFFGPRGEGLAERLVGLTVPGFYQSYLDQRIALARSRLAAQVR